MLTVSYLTPVNAVTDAELEALEKQIEQMEAEEKEQAEAEEKKKAEDEAKRIADQKRKANAEAERKRLSELEKQRREEEERLAEESKKREKMEKKEKYTRLIAEAEQAVTNKDKELAISKYSEALTLSPGDSVANSGIKEAKKLMDKECYEILGDWNVDWALSKNIKVTFDEDNTGLLHPVPHLSVNWSCIDSSARKFHVIIQSTIYPNKQPNEWKIALSPNGNSLFGTAESGQPVKGEKINTSGLTEEEKSSNHLIEVVSDICSIIIGVWRWNDLLRTTTRFYEDGKVVSKNILKSEGNWECVDPEKKRFTFNTWNKKRDIQIEDDYKKFHSVGLLGEKLNANKISDDPFEKIVPAKNSNSNVPGL